MLVCAHETILNKTKQTILNVCIMLNQLSWLDSVWEQVNLVNSLLLGFVFMKVEVSLLSLHDSYEGCDPENVHSGWDKKEI